MAILSLVVAGFFSGGLSHWIVWALTALGAIDGPYTAYRHDATFAAMLAAGIVAGVVGIIAIACTLASGMRSGGSWFAALQHTIAHIGPLRAFNAVFCVQLSAIISLEGVEQVTQLGHTLGPAAALGAPLIAGIAIHALCAAVVVSLLFYVAQAVVRAESCIRGLLSPQIRRRSSSNGSAHSRLHLVSEDIVRPAPLSLRFANRPPPSI
jgi:hypothetical protein